MRFGRQRLKRRVGPRIVPFNHAPDILGRHRARLDGQLQGVQLLGGDRSMWECFDGELPGKAPYKGLVPTTRRRLTIPVVTPTVQRNCSGTPTVQPPAFRCGLAAAVW